MSHLQYWPSGSGSRPESGLIFRGPIANRFGIEYFSYLIVPRVLGQDVGLSRLNVNLLEDLMLCFNENSLLNGTKAALVAYLEFIMFQKTNSLDWLDGSIKHQTEALEAAESSEIGHTSAAATRHNLVVFRFQRFNETESNEDLEAAILVAEQASNDSQSLQLLETDYLSDLSLLRKARNRIKTTSPSISMQAFAALQSTCKDIPTIWQIVRGDFGLLCEKLRVVLKSGNVLGGPRLKLAQTLVLSSFYRASSSGITEIQKIYGDRDLIADLNLVAEDLRNLQPGLSRCFYLGTVGFALYLEYLRGKHVTTLEMAQGFLQASIEVPNNCTERSSDILKRHPLLVIGDMWGKFLRCPAWPDEQTLPPGFGRLLCTRILYAGILANAKVELYGLYKDLRYVTDAKILADEAWSASDLWGADASIPGLAVVRCSEAFYSLSDQPIKDLGIIEKVLPILDKLLCLPLHPAQRMKTQIYQCRFWMWQGRKKRDSTWLKKLNEAIELGESVLLGMDTFHPDRLAHLTVLFELCMEHAKLFSSPNNEYSDRAFELATEALEQADTMTKVPGISEKDADVARTRALRSYGAWFYAQFQHTQDRDFLTNAIKIHMESLSLLGRIDEQQVQYVDCQDSLAIMRCQLFDLTDADDDLQGITESIDWIQNALLQMRTSRRVKQLKSTLCQCLVARYRRDDVRYSADAEHAMCLASQIKEVDYALPLSQVYIGLYDKNGDSEALTQALDCAQMSASLMEDDDEYAEEYSSFGTKADHWARCKSIYDIAELHLERAKRSKVLCWSDDAAVALKYFRRCVSSRSINLTLFIKAANHLCHPIFVSSGKLGMPELADITEKAVGLLPKTASRALSRRDMQKMLRAFVGVASNAAASALEANRGAEKALEVLEAGRGMLATQLLDFRPKRISATDSELTESEAAQLSMLEEKLAQLEAVTDIDSNYALTSAGSSRSAGKAYKLNVEIEEILDNLPASAKRERMLLRSPRAADMKAGICNGVIIVLNLSFRCDAIIVREGKIESLPLPLLHKEHAEVLAEAFERTQSNPEGFSPTMRQHFAVIVLLWLWEMAVEPTLDFLGFNRTPSLEEAWPRVWWVPTGSLSQFPFHAAGYHGSSNSAHPDATIDRVISSYSSSLRSLMFTWQNLRDKEPEDRNNPMVLVSMTRTEGLKSLQFVADEVKGIQAVLEDSLEISQLAEPCKRDVLEALETCNIFHFAGHGASVIDNPDRGSLYLNDWRLDPLTVRDILRLKLHLRAPWLAYLSACSTGTNQANELRDEGVHLVAAFQLAGFQHIIGSFWEVSDPRSQQIAEDFYGYLRNTIGRGHDVALALHKAVRNLRTSLRERPRPAENTRSLSPTNAETILDDGKGLPPQNTSEDHLATDEDVETGDWVHGNLEVDADELVKGIRGSSTESVTWTEGEWEELRNLVLEKQKSGTYKKLFNNPLVWAPYFHVGL